MSANVTLRTLGDYVKRKANLFIICDCGHSAVVDAEKLNRWYLCHNWNTNMEVVGGHLRCTRCKGRPDRFAPTPRRPDRPNWMSSEDDWKRLVRRLRG